MTPRISNSTNSYLVTVSLAKLIRSLTQDPSDLSLSRHIRAYYSLSRAT